MTDDGAERGGYAPHTHDQTHARRAVRQARALHGVGCIMGEEECSALRVTKPKVSTRFFLPATKHDRGAKVGGGEGGGQGPCLLPLLRFGDMPCSRMPWPKGLRGVIHALG